MAAPLTILDQVGLLADLKMTEPYRIIEGTDHHHKPWEQAQAADIVFTTPAAGWKNAPHQRPDGWPGKLTHFHTISAGIDSFPSWVFDVANVTCGRATTSDSIADYVFAVLLEAEKKLGATLLGLERRQSPDEFPAGGLDERVLAIAGYGAVAKAIIRRALAFGMKVRIIRRSPQASDDQVTFVRSFPDLLHKADYAVLALPLTQGTQNFASGEFFACAPSRLHLINVSRGETLDQDALKSFLERCPEAVATLDVTTPEPLPDGHWLLSHPRVRITPHVSWKDHRFGERNRELFLENVNAISRGEVPIGHVESQTTLKTQ